MPLLALQTPGLKLGMQGDAFTVKQNDKIIRFVPSHEVEEVHLYGRVELSSVARAWLLEQRRRVVFFSAQGLFQGELVGPGSPHAERRVVQYRALSDPRRRFLLARDLVCAKLHNQAAVTLRWKRNHTADAAPLQRCEDLILASLHQARALEGDLDRLRGLEGAAARASFDALAIALSNKDLGFQGRNRRPPRDPVNATLSFAYTLLTSRCLHALHIAGLDPHLGALHEPGRAAPALAFDLAEPFRPLVDRFTAALFNRKQLQPDHFDGLPDDAQGVLLNPEGRRAFSPAWSQLWDTTLPWRGQHASLTHTLTQHAHLLNRVLDQHQPFQPLALGE